MLGKRAGKTDLIGPSEGGTGSHLMERYKSNPSTDDKFENQKSRHIVLTPTRSVPSPKTETDNWGKDRGGPQGRADLRWLPEPEAV